MPMETIKKEVRAKIVEVCPELMKLSFGCEVDIDWWGDGKNFNRRKFGDCQCGDEMRVNGEMEVIEDSITGRIVKIVGHPIQLDLARYILPKELWGELILKWEKGNLDQQTDETQKWMFDNMDTL
jgi:hypothetical protein